MSEDHGQQENDGALGTLIELERRIEIELSEARDAAQRVVEAARRESLEQASERESTMAGEQERLRLQIERECEASLREIATEGEQALQRYQRLDDAAQQRLAQWVVAKLSEEAAES